MDSFSQSAIAFPHRSVCARTRQCAKEFPLWSNIVLDMVGSGAIGMFTVLLGLRIGNKPSLSSLFIICLYFLGGEGRGT